MIVIKTPQEMTAFAECHRAGGKTIGLVPTMGYFHEGHLSLMRRSVAENDVTIVSLFVNPAQFGPAEDLAAYPRDFERDSALAASAGVCCIFNPEPPDIYPDGYKTYITVEDWSEKLCGVTRPSHFRGVATICCKLFNITRPHRAYFGLKDAQQYLILNKMVADLNMGLELVPMPIVRESDGLAMSSRNVYLTPGQRADAPLINQALTAAENMVAEGNTDFDSIKTAIAATLSNSPHIGIDYIEAVSTTTLEPLAAIVPGGTLLALAARVGRARLIDNRML